MKEEIVVPITNKEGKPFAGKKHSVTIDDLAEGYKHKYRAYWWVVRKSDMSFVCKAKNKWHAQQIIKNCKCQDVWRPQSRLEDEPFLQSLTRTNREQHQGTHNFLDTQQRYKDEELKFDRKRVSEQNQIIKQHDKASRIKYVRQNLGIEGLRHDIKERASKGQETYDDREILSHLDVENSRKEIIEHLKGAKTCGLL